jgi:hypothetical protein
VTQWLAGKNTLSADLQGNVFEYGSGRGTSIRIVVKKNECRDRPHGCQEDAANDRLDDGLVPAPKKQWRNDRHTGQEKGQPGDKYHRAARVEGVIARIANTDEHEKNASQAGRSPAKSRFPRYAIQARVEPTGPANERAAGAQYQKSRNDEDLSKEDGAQFPSVTEDDQGGHPQAGSDEGGSAECSHVTIAEG